MQEKTLEENLRDNHERREDIIAKQAQSQSPIPSPRDQSTPRESPDSGGATGSMDDVARYADLPHLIVPDLAEANQMVDNCIDDADRWIRDNLSADARAAWLDAPWLAKVLISRDEITPDRVPNKSPLVTHRIKEAKDFVAWETDNISADRQRRKGDRLIALYSHRTNEDARHTIRAFAGLGNFEKHRQRDGRVSVRLHRPDHVVLTTSTYPLGLLRLNLAWQNARALVPARVADPEPR